MTPTLLSARRRMRKCLLAVLGVVFASGLLTPAHARDKAVNLLRHDAARVASSNAAAAQSANLRRMFDGDAATTFTIPAKSGRPLEVVFGFAGKTVSPQEIEVVLSPQKAGAAAATVEVLASTVTAAAGYQSLRTDVLKAVAKPQRFSFKPVAARWILVRITPMPSFGDVPVAEIAVTGHAGPPATRYAFKESPAKAFTVLAELRKSVDVRVSPDETALFADVRNGRLNRFSFAEAALIASGVTDGDKRKSYLKKIDELERSARQALAGAKDPEEQGRRLLEWMHAGPLKAGYRSHQTRVSTLLDDGTYNCVSSAVFYNILGRRLGLDLRGIEVPDHAFSVLYVGTRHFDVETTTNSGFAPARNAAVLKELREKHGIRYIPDRNRASRREIRDTGLAALIYYNRGVDSLKARQHGRALVAFFCALSLDPEFASAVKNVLAVMTNWSLDLSKAGKFEEALKVIEVGRKLAPQDATLAHNQTVVWTKWAQTTADAGRYDDALKILIKADAAVAGGKFDSLRSWIFIGPGEKLARQEKWTAAHAVAALGLKKLDGKPRKDLDEWRIGLYLRQGNAKMTKRNFSEAAAAFARGLKTAPSDAKILNNLAYLTQEWTWDVYRKQGVDKAVAVATQLRKQFPKVDGVAKSASNVAWRIVDDRARSGKYAEALKLVKATTSLLTADAEKKLAASVYDRWARSHWQTKQDFDNALEIYRKGLKELPGDSLLTQNAVYVWNRKGTTHIKARDWRQAIAVYQAAVKEFPNSSTLQGNLRYCEQELKRGT